MVANIGKTSPHRAAPGSSSGHSPLRQPAFTGVRVSAAPSFYITARQPLRPGAVLLAIVIAAGVLSTISYGLGRTGHARLRPDGASASRSTGAAVGASSTDDDKDDPDQIDVIALGDAADAPVPAPRKGGHASTVHPTILVHLPRFGNQVGLIPSTPAGHLLYSWLAAFNQGSYPSLGSVMPNAASAATASAQITLRRQTGGFNLLSAREVQPGVLVFRLRDQTPEGTEVLGTLHVRPDSNPPAITSFSLRAIPAPPQSRDSGTQSPPSP